jgi:hypothetical protein
MQRIGASLSRVIACALVLAVPTCQCQQAGPTLSRHARRIKSEVVAVPTGARITVVMKSGSANRGTVNHMESITFWLDEEKLGQPVKIAYNDVSKIRSNNTSHAVKHAVVTGFIVCGVILMIVLVAPK